MSVLRYPRGAVAGDLARGGVGCALVGTPLAASSPPGWLATVLGLCLLLFAAFTATGILRAVRRYHVDALGITVEPGGARLAWDALERLDLAYYSTRRDGREGWLQLTLRADTRVLRLDSRLAGFEALLREALAAARRRGIPLTPATRANLEAVGLDPGQVHP